MLDLPATATRADIEKAIEGKIVARGAFTERRKAAKESFLTYPSLADSGEG